MVALSICVFTVVKIYSAPTESPVSQLTPASASSPSNGQLPVLPELSAQTRRQLQAPVPPGAAGALPDALAAVPGTPADGHSPDGHSPDGHSPDGHSPDGQSPDGRSAAGRSPDGRWPDARSSQGPPRGPGARLPNAQVTNPGRTSTPPGSAQRPEPATARTAQDPNRPDAAEDPETAAPAEPPEVIYIPETPEERDARMRRELADSVCDQYGVQREACRARTARR